MPCIKDLVTIYCNRTMRTVPPDDAITSSVFEGGLLAHVFTPSLSHVRGTDPCLCLRRNAARCECFKDFRCWKLGEVSRKDRGTDFLEEGTWSALERGKQSVCERDRVRDRGSQRVLGES
jgi:hypothetical protein